MSTHRSPHRIAVSCAIIIAFAAAFVALPGSRASAQDRSVGMSLLLGFSPSTLGLETGDTVIWENQEVFDYPVVDGTHRVVADDGSFDSGDIQPNQRFAMKFLEPGEIAYKCIIHPTTMKGVLQITGDPITAEPLEREVAIVEPQQDPQSWTYEPDDITVPAGTTITWRNNGGVAHTVTAADGSFDSGDMEPGDTFTFTFDEPTSLRYACKPHPWMTGLVRVGGAGGTPPPPPPVVDPGPSEPVVVEQPDPAGDEPATWNILAVEPDAAKPLEWGFDPASLTIRVGDSIVWKNAGASAHTVTADDGSFDSGMLDAGETFTLTFDEPMTISFFCQPHPWMKGTVLVVAADVSDDALPPPPEVQDDDEPGTGSTGKPGHGDAGVDTDPDPAAAVRAPFAVATSGFISLFALVLILPTLMERLRRRRPQPVPIDEQREAREPVHV